MQKFFETLKRSTIFYTVVIVIAIALTLFGFGCMALATHRKDVAQKATIEELQTDLEKLKAEKETKEKEWQAEKEKLEEENKELEEENDKVSAIADAQLDRILWLLQMYDIGGVPVVGIAEEFSLLGYYGNTEEEAQTATIKLKAGHSKVLFEFEFPETTKKAILTTPKGEKLDMVIRKNTIDIPLTKKGIYTLKISLKNGETKYLAFS